MPRGDDRLENNTHMNVVVLDKLLEIARGERISHAASIPEYHVDFIHEMGFVDLSPI